MFGCYVSAAGVGMMAAGVKTHSVMSLSSSVALFVAAIALFWVGKRTATGKGSPPQS
jgi:hypothetical protein